MNVSTYHILLRTSALILALVLLFDSGLLSPITKELSQNTQQYLAQAVGVGARVASTDLNEVTAALTARDQALDEREAAIEEREIAVGLSSGSAPFGGSNTSTYIMSLLLFILIVLIVLNYVLDYLRAAENRLKTKRHAPTT